MVESNLPAAGMRVICLLGSVAKFGAERSSLEMLAALRKQGAKVLLIVSDAPWGAEIRDHVSEMGFEYVMAPNLSITPTGSWIWKVVISLRSIIFASLILSVQAIKFKPTHIQAAATYYILNFLPYFLFFRTKLVYRCDMEPINHNFMWKIIWSYTKYRSSIFIAVSDYISNVAVRFGADPKKIRLIYNRPSSRILTDEMGGINIDSNTFNIVFVGQIIDTKGPHYLIKAFSNISEKYNDAKLIIVGRISSWSGDLWARQLRDSANVDERIRGRIQFTGFVENIPDLLAKCNLSVVPSLVAEAMGNVVLESKQAGIPTIVFPSGGLMNTVNHGVDGYICSEKTVPELEKALRFYLEHPDIATRQGLMARKSLAAFVENFEEKSVEAYRSA